MTLELIRIAKTDGINDAQLALVQKGIETSLDGTGRFTVTSGSNAPQRTDCDGDECFTQLGTRLGVDLIATAEVYRSNDITSIQLKAFKVRSGTMITRVQQFVRSDKDLTAALDVMAHRIAVALDDLANPVRRLIQPVVLLPALAPLPPAALETAVTGPAPKPMSTIRTAGVAMSVIGGVALIAACIIGGTAQTDSAKLSATARPLNEGKSLINSINGRAVGANVLFGIGGSIAAAGVVMAVAF